MSTIRSMLFGAAFVFLNLGQDERIAAMPQDEQPPPASGQETKNPNSWQDAFTTEVFESDGSRLPYRLLSPSKMEAGKKYPLVLFLHGAGERGDDNDRQLVHGLKDFHDRIDQNPAFVIAPQCPNENTWCDVNWSGTQHTMSEEPNATMMLTLGLVEQFMKDHPVDLDRVYVTGLSMGGFGTFDIVARRPDWFAAAAPICGGADHSDEVMKRVADIPFWIAHGADDRAVAVERSRNAVAALEKAGNQPIYVEMKGVGHDSWSATYADDHFHEWLFSQKRSEK